VPVALHGASRSTTSNLRAKGGIRPSLTTILGKRRALSPPSLVVGI
jgi:hypothetical protein